MPTQKLALLADIKRLDDDTARVLILQALYVRVGEGMSAPHIQRFITTQSANSFSKFRLEEMLEILIRSKMIGVDKKTSKNGRITKRYELTPQGLILLIANNHLLPKDIKKSNCTPFAEVFRFALAEMERMKTLYKETTTIATIENQTLETLGE